MVWLGEYKVWNEDAVVVVIFIIIPNNNQCIKYLKA